MTDATRFYTADNCRAAYQLNWAVSLFWREPVRCTDWLAEFKAALEPDGIRILQHRYAGPDVSVFLVSTRPELPPVEILKATKGRLQYLVRSVHPKAFRRNYALRSIGSCTREGVEGYVAGQVQHHPMADPRVQQIVEDVQIGGPTIDLSMERRSAHAIYWYNLHVCFVNDGRLMETRRETLERMRRMVLRAAVKKGHLLSRGGLLPDHVHLTLGCGMAESPAEVAISYMNNLAYACGSKRVFAYGYYVGTFGEYDLGVTWQQ